MKNWNTHCDRASKIYGRYTVKSPYHKNKRLPFNIIGTFSEGTVLVETVEYEGSSSINVTSSYRIDDIEARIKEGFLKRRVNDIFK